MGSGVGLEQAELGDGRDRAAVGRGGDERTGRHAFLVREVDLLEVDRDRAVDALRVCLEDGVWLST